MVYGVGSGGYNVVAPYQNLQQGCRSSSTTLHVCRLEPFYTYVAFSRSQNSWILLLLPFESTSYVPAAQGAGSMPLCQGIWPHFTRS